MSPIAANSSDHTRSHAQEVQLSSGTQHLCDVDDSGEPVDQVWPLHTTCSYSASVSALLAHLSTSSTSLWRLSSVSHPQLRSFPTCQKSSSSLLQTIRLGIASGHRSQRRETPLPKIPTCPSSLAATSLCPVFRQSISLGMEMHLSVGNLGSASSVDPLSPRYVQRQQ